MTPAALAASADTDAVPPDGVAAPLLALWWERHGDWEKAHAAIADDEGGQGAAWVHAYLHRREGDLGNAHYWYRRAGRPVATGPLDAEWDAIAAGLLTAPP